MKLTVVKAGTVLMFTVLYFSVLNYTIVYCTVQYYCSPIVVLDSATYPCDEAGTVLHSSEL